MESRKEREERCRQDSPEKLLLGMMSPEWSSWYLLPISPEQFKQHPADGRLETTNTVALWCVYKEGI